MEITDRELLEGAAKACGIIGYYDEWNEMGEQKLKGIRSPGKWGVWNPLEYENQAVRISDLLRFSAEERRHLVTKWIDNEKYPYWRTSSCYAIVRAAYEIGKDMP